MGGVIAINQLGWQAKKQQDPEVYFAGSLNNVSLEAGYFDYKDSNNKYKQHASIELTLGKENCLENSIIIGYQLGLAVVSTSFTTPVLTPSAKIYLTINF